ncbi:hypothetical protein [Prescottella equi]|uniref:hypothetical protein n=1 Tax=Rhodococcus hoagii TaxID=43767 RepID=UPI00111C4998|nr:hypothetical protein [Prescottella equi]
MADEIRQRQAAESNEAAQLGQVGADRFDQLVRQLDRLLPECAQALKELGVEPTAKVGFMKYGWKLWVNITHPDVDRTQSRNLVVTKNGAWTFAEGTSGPSPRPRSEISERQAWIDSAAARRPPYCAPEEEMREQLLRAVRLLYDRQSRTRGA